MQTTSQSLSAKSWWSCLRLSSTVQATQSARRNNIPPALSLTKYHQFYWNQLRQQIKTTLARVGQQSTDELTYSDTDYGINQSAVRLLQTLFCDHTPSDRLQSHYFNPVFYHGCSLLGTCPNCIIDYRIRHLPEDVVCLDGFVVTGGPPDRDPQRFADRSVQLPLRAYANQVVDFAEEALSFLAGSRGEDYERDLFENLRKEHEFLLSMGRQLIAGSPL